MMTADPLTPLPERAAQALAALGVPAQCRAAPAGACTLRLGPKGQWTDYRAVAVPALARATLGAALMQARQAVVEFVMAAHAARGEQPAYKGRLLTYHRHA